MSCTLAKPTAKIQISATVKAPLDLLQRDEPNGYMMAKYLMGPEKESNEKKERMNMWLMVVMV